MVDAGVTPYQLSQAVTRLVATRDPLMVDLAPCLQALVTKRLHNEPCGEGGSGRIVLHNTSVDRHTTDHSRGAPEMNRIVTVNAGTSMNWWWRDSQAVGRS